MKADAYSYKWVRQFLPHSLIRDESNIQRHLDRGWQEVPYDEVDRLPKSLVGDMPAGASGLILYRMHPDAYWWTTLNLVVRSNLAMEFAHAHLPAMVQVTIERDEPATR